MGQLTNSFPGTFLLITALAITAGSARADDTAVIQAWVDAWNSHDPSAVAALFTEDAVYEDVTLGVVTHGLVQLRAFAQGAFDAISDFHIELLNSSLKGGHGTIEYMLSGTDRGLFRTGKRFAVRAATIIDVRGTKISRNSDYYDLAAILRPIGLLTGL